MRPGSQGTARLNHVLRDPLASAALKFKQTTPPILQVFCRLDYHFATPKLAALAQREAIYTARKFSDHAPLAIDYDFKL
jgi:endonuclease/exonuclease/phosphatase family metal-dependent hydrolase